MIKFVTDKNWIETDDLLLVARRQQCLSITAWPTITELYMTAKGNYVTHEYHVDEDETTAGSWLLVDPAVAYRIYTEAGNKYGIVQPSKEYEL